jgi:homocysteine S-methyltransferase
LEGYPHLPAWVSCSCGDGLRLWHGEPLSAVVELVNGCDTVVATGVNCTAPQWVESLLLSVADLSTKPLSAYPNRGEQWDAEAMCWVEGSGVKGFDVLAQRWYAAGARLIGGCCRTTPADIAEIAAALVVKEE